MKSESDLIVQALSGGDQAAKVSALTFLADAGMIPHYRDQVLKVATKDNGNALPSFQKMAPANSVEMGTPSFYFINPYTRERRLVPETPQCIDIYKRWQSHNHSITDLPPPCLNKPTSAQP